MSVATGPEEFKKEFKIANASTGSLQDLIVLDTLSGVCTDSTRSWEALRGWMGTIPAQ